MIILYAFVLMILVGVISQTTKKRRESKEAALREYQFQENLRYYLSHGRKIEAIKECKDYYGCSLSKAKTIVSEIEFELTYEKEISQYYRPYAHGRAQGNISDSQVEFDTSSYVAYIDGMEGHEFERFCADLLLKNGFDKADVTRGSGDQGVDIVALKDGIKYAIQCKNYRTPLGNTPVQEVNAGKTFYGCHVAAVITNSTFTKNAHQLASATGVLLWDRNYLEQLIEKSRIRINSSECEPYDEEKEDPCEIDQTFDQLDDAVDGYQPVDFKTSCREPEQNDGIKPDAADNIPKLRKGMLVFMILCLLEVAFSLFAAIDSRQIEMFISMGGFFGTLAWMFYILAKSLKYSPVVLIKGRLITKPKFVLLSIMGAFSFAVLAIIVFLIFTSILA